MEGLGADFRFEDCFKDRTPSQSWKLDQGDHAEPFCLGAVLPFSAVVWLQRFSSLSLGL